MNLDLELIFPIIDPPSARLMGTKAQCLFEAGIITAAQKKTIDRRANEIGCNFTAESDAPLKGG